MNEPILDVKVIDHQNAAGMMHRIGRSLEPDSADVERLLHRIGASQSAAQQVWLDRETDIEGRQFRPLSARYAAQYRGGSHGKPGTIRGTKHILVDTGKMRASIHPTVTGHQVAIGITDITQARKSWAHQLGHGVPERAHLGFRDQDRKDITDEFNDWVDGLNRRGSNEQ